ncbi:hypothetical protein [Actimicrobium sp. CCI2.3]|uniref:hypothetical protein n=1 Tax=Actimicrobium sp. CCI2.3 TaxID=3048616 RepID=UPI002AB5C495|nr:hypothetical protein [Actimicrobium sp. CCI2.3]MDY7573151.1 hypothetical protein [Actimicrobium sp. CCI2.3]MEB0022130.1 hypothetical protein [Actimicrobium sp. CCI2.3]
MNDESPISKVLTPAQRKEKLIREGANFRAGIRSSIELVGNNLQTDTLARSIITQLTGTAYAAVGSLLRVKGANLQTLLPIVVSGISFVVKARLLLPLLRTTAVAGVVGAGAYFLLRRRSRTSEDDSV